MTTIRIGVMGFSVSEQGRLQHIFALSDPQTRFYQFTELTEPKPVEILLVKQGDSFVPQQQQSYLARHFGSAIQIVPVARKPLADLSPFPAIFGVLIPSRVLGVLDKIVMPTQSNSRAANESLAESVDVGVLRVLVVDDSHLMQKTIRLELEKSSLPLAIDFASSGEVALEKVQQFQYAIIFLDVGMPGLDGFETCAEMRKLAGFSKTPIIMLTAKTSAVDEVKGLMAGCTSYLTKPFTHEDFHKTLERIVHWIKESRAET